MIAVSEESEAAVAVVFGSEEKGIIKDIGGMWGKGEEEETGRRREA